MSPKADELFQLALDLPEQDRADLAARLLWSLEAEAEEDVEQAWSDEIERRIAAADSGEEQILSWDEARARLFPDT
ncbi:MAG TPA: addiction module protein [Thermoanaerobaculia bacterium]|nr:addiction module protein [Thermoanaerobaculia bacterium]